MTKFNYRHSLQTLNKALSSVGHKFNFIMQSGNPCWVLYENIGSAPAVCGYYYTATDAAEIATTLINK
jgi:hypothetical protein